MRIVIALDKFRGSLSAELACDALATGLQAAAPHLEVDIVPVADGGEGTVAAALRAGFEPQTTIVSGPLANPVEAIWALSGRRAVIELAAASGLDLLRGREPNALAASSRGTGELLLAALDAGCDDIVLAVGGSACTDGGAGLLAALGATLRRADGATLEDGGGPLSALDTIDLSGLDARLRAVRLTLASDVDNPLLGARGAAQVFAPQKGATPAQARELERSLERFVVILEASPGVRSGMASAPAAGAAGGVGYAALAALGATRAAGAAVVLDFTGLAKRMPGASLVVSGEGSLDEQSLGGKAAIAVASLARRHGVPALAVCGRNTLTQVQLTAAGFAGCFTLVQLEPDPVSSMAAAGPLLERTGALIVARLTDFVH